MPSFPIAAPEDELAAWFEHGTGAAVIDELLVRQEDVAPWQIDLLARRIPPADPAHVVRAHATREVVQRVNSPASAPSLMLVLAHVADELAFQRSDPQPPLCYRKFQGVLIIAAEPEVQADYAALLALLLGEPEACTVVELCSIDQAAAFVPDTGSERMLAALERAYPERGLVYAFGCTGGRVFIGSEDWINVLAAALRETIRQESG